jgi:hypothetical protein
MRRIILVAAVIVGSAGTAIAARAPAPPPPPPPIVVSTVLCTYASQTYSVGAQLPTGQLCQPDGTWKAAPTT